MRIFLDTSILIEYIKGTKTTLLERLIKEENQLYINSIVYSEFMFHFISAVTGKSPFTIKQKKRIKEILNIYEPIEFINQFEMLTDCVEIINQSYLFMKNYNLLPNDSIILSTCKFYKIEALATYDNDFKEIATKENIKLINE
jgi:predicted nucleic acid-binding protein